jgi:hypothetical protein
MTLICSKSSKTMYKTMTATITDNTAKCTIKVSLSITNLRHLATENNNIRTKPAIQINVKQQHLVSIGRLAISLTTVTQAF